MQKCSSDWPVSRNISSKKGPKQTNGASGLLKIERFKKKLKQNPLRNRDEHEPCS